MHFMEKTVTPAVLHHGVNALPDEVLLKIIHCCVEEQRDFNQPPTRQRVVYNRIRRVVETRQLALVNQRFRELVNGLPSLWTNARFFLKSERETSAENGRPPWMLGKSTGSGLEVLIEYPEHYESLLRYKDQCTSFSAASQQIIGTIPQNRVLAPVLKALRLYDNDKVLDAFHLPSLRALVTRVSSLASVRLVMPQLTSLTLRYEVKQPADVDALVSVVGIGKSLRQLGLSLHFNTKLNDDGWTQSVHCLPALESLNVLPYFGYCNGQAGSFHVQAATTIVRSFEIPKVLSISLSWITEYDRSDPIPDWHALFPRDRELVHLRDFFLSVESSSKPLQAAFHIPSLLQRFPQLSNLHSSLGDVDSIRSFTELARLREITFRDCQLEMPQLGRFVASLFKQDVINVERLTVHMDRNIDEFRYTRDAMPVDSRRLTVLVRDILRRESDTEFCVKFSEDIVNLF